MHEVISADACRAAAAQAWRREAMADAVGKQALRALHREVGLSPKPGLVSPLDSGSHVDMDYHCFLKSLAALRGYFPRIAALGFAGADFEALRRLGIRAEAGMLAATGGVNTHRGAIFNLGLLCAAAGARAARGLPLTAGALCREASLRWGDAILAGAGPAAQSHGAEVARRFGRGGARQEAAAGFPSVLGIGLPAYRQALAATGDPEVAAVHSLFALIADIEDTNLLWRGGWEGQRFAHCRARAFLAEGGVTTPGWRERAGAIHREFVARNLSPGGSADLLGLTLFLEGLDDAPGDSLQRAG